MLNAGMLTISMRQGQTGEIAAYTVMTAALAWVTIVAVGGSSLLYVTGDDHERRAVRSQRILIALPMMTVSAGCVAAVYADRGYGSVALATSAVVVIANNLSELQFGDLARQMRFVAASNVMIMTKLLALALLLGGAPLTGALATGSVVQLLTGEVLVYRGQAGRSPLWRGLSVRSAAAAFRMNRQLMSYSTAEAFTGRAGGIALSAVATPQVVGCYGALNGIYQALAAVLYQGLRVPMAVRVRRRHGLESSGPAGRESELIIAAAATVTAICGVASAPWISNELLRLPIPESAIWLQLFAIAIPFMTINRAVGLNRLGDSDYRRANRLALLTAALIAVALLVQLPDLSPAGAAGATTAAEALTVWILGMLALSRRWRAGIGHVRRHHRGSGGSHRPLGRRVLERTGASPADVTAASIHPEGKQQRIGNTSEN